MLAIDTPRTHYFDCLPSKSKRKLDDYTYLDCGKTRMQKNSNSKGKSVVDETTDHQSTVRSFSRGESSQSNGVDATPIQFFVRMIEGGKTLVLRGNLNDTVEMVHEKIQTMTGIPIIEQRLIYRGKQLQLKQTLEQCSVEKDAGFQLVGRMRSTGNPSAWRVINDMVTIICRVCRNEIPFSGKLVKSKLENYISLTLDKDKYDPSLVNGNRKKGSKEKKKLIGNDDDDEEEEEDEEKENERKSVNESIDKVDCCRVFMDAFAPQALVMLYMAPDKRNQVCADECIRRFLSFLSSLEGTGLERAYCATIVLEFCRLLRRTTAAVEDNSLYLHCRSTLGSMLEKVEVVSGPSGLGASKCITFEEVFPFLKEVAQQLVKDLILSVESNGNSGPLERHVSDFSAFLQAVESFIRMRLEIGAAVHKAKGKVSSSGEEVDHLFHLFDDLLSWIEKCLNNMKACLVVKRKKEVEVNRSGWSEYLAILKELSRISALHPGFEDRFWSTMRQNKAAVCGLILRYAKHPDDSNWLLRHKNILDFESRRHLALLMFPEAREDYEELLEMLIDRSQLLAESFEYVYRARPSSLQAGLFMEFKNEQATGPGVLREWFCLLCQAIFDPQNALFVACPLHRRRFFPNPASKVDPLHLQYFCFSGRVIALALMHKIQVGVVLDRVFFMQLAGRRVSLEDIRDADPCMYNSCKQILELDAEFVNSDGLGLTFVTEVEELGSRKVVELRSGGKETVVNSKNRKEYVNLIVQHRFVISISEQVSSFSRGFSDILRASTFRATFFEGLELEDLDWMLHGSESEISVRDWKAHTDYTGYKRSDPQIVWFWEVVRQLNAEQKKNLLFFWTSVKYLPVDGFRGLSSCLFIYKSLESQEHLPSSHTCFYRLCLPPYPSKAVVRDRLLVITQDHVGCSFGTW